MSSFGDTDLIKLLHRQYGTKALVMYYLKQAKDASGRARVALSSKNPHALGAEAQTMMTNIEMLYKILADDEHGLDDKK